MELAVLLSAPLGHGQQQCLAVVAGIQQITPKQQQQQYKAEEESRSVQL
jgi:hypothetical protein